MSKAKTQWASKDDIRLIQCHIKRFNVAPMLIQHPMLPGIDRLLTTLSANRQLEVMYFNQCLKKCPHHDMYKKIFSEISTNTVN